jgi:hypothetical protein
VVESWGIADPFFRAHADQPPLRDFFAELQAEAKAIAFAPGILSAERSRWISELVKAKSQKTFFLSLSNLGTLTSSNDRCPAISSELPEGRFREVLAGRPDLVRAMESEKADFSKDSAIYCQLETLKSKLAQVIGATETGCARKKSAKATQDCLAGTRGTLQQEISDLDSRRAFDWGKLQRKWSPDILELIDCRSP